MPSPLAEPHRRRRARLTALRTSSTHRTDEATTTEITQCAPLNVVVLKRPWRAGTVTTTTCSTTIVASATHSAPFVSV